MEYINCVVDTQPMANELQSVSNHVTGTTTAVVAMQAAVIKADQDAADRVCHDVNRGFHALMSSQLSQKIAKLQSDVDSHLLRLNQQAKQLLNIKKQMERDYQRTAMRYCKTFNSINKELRQRVQDSVHFLRRISSILAKSFFCNTKFEPRYFSFTIGLTASSSGLPLNRMRPSNSR